MEVGPADGWVRFAVLDTGVGIPGESLPHVFEPFYTTKEASCGTGLGLSVCKRIVERAGGRIEVANRPEGGTAVAVLFRTSAPRE